MIKEIPELHDIEEPEAPKTKEEIENELKQLEAEDEAEDEKFDKEDNEGAIPMTETEIKNMNKQTTNKEKKKSFGATTTPQPIKPGKELPGSKTVNKKNIIEATKTLLYKYPTKKEWEKIHELKPQRIIFYFTMTKEEYKQLFLCQVKYRTKIIGSIGARVV